MLCDFGLSRVKADITSRAVNIDAESTAGNRNWMAPERLLGGSVQKSSDIYAFGMTVYEVPALSIHSSVDRFRLLFAGRCTQARSLWVILPTQIS